MRAIAEKQILTISVVVHQTKRSRRSEDFLRLDIVATVLRSQAEAKRRRIATLYLH